MPSKLLNYIRQHIWAPLPKEASYKTLAASAVIWAIILPALAWLFRSWGRFSDATFRVILIGGVVLGLAQLIPRAGEKVYLGLLRGMSIIGYIVFRIGLTVVFYLVVTPMGWALRLAGKDPLLLRGRGGDPPRWRPHHGRNEPKRYYRLF